jgi:hypothetical protein
MTRSLGLFYAVSGAVLAWSATLVAGLAQPATPAASPSESGPAPEPDAPRSPSQTLKSGEPPEIVGAAFDDDGAMATSAPSVASYTLDARLDEATHRITAHGTITWQNASTKPANELYFHLYLNAFKNNRTVFSRSPFGASRSGKGTRHWGYIDVKRLGVREMDGTNVWPENVAAASEDPEDETDVRVPLPRPVAPGATVHLDVEFEDVLPEIVERTGYARDFHMVGQWFPKVARREPDGVWVHFPFHSQSEFYADYGSYDVTLDVAKALVVGATGTRVSTVSTGARRRDRYQARDVHDFAWTAWEHFVERDARVDGVDVRVLFPPGNDANADATVAAVVHGLRFFGAAFGRYPYPVLTVVHPPVFAPAAGGMEYPTLITTGFPWYTATASSLVERVTLHELGHQWFYGLVATDEHSFPFLDEGLTTYAESESMKALFGDASAFRAPGLRVDGNAYERMLAADAGHDDIVARPAKDFVTFRALGALVYARTGTVFETLARVYGREKVRRAVGRYARYYRFEHPGPKHLIGVMREVLGDEAADFLVGALFQGKTLDYVAKDLRSTRAAPPAGVFDKSTGRTTTDAPSNDGAPGKWLARVVLYRHGDLRLPVDVEFRLENGGTLRKRFDGRARVASVECAADSPVVAAIVDPDLRLLIDDDLTNNATSKRAGTAARLVERGLYAAELGFTGVGP